MSLEEVNGGFIPRRDGAVAHIPKDLSEGVSLPVSGVSLIPLAASAGMAANASAGVADGYAVFWGGASVGTDVDEIAKLGGGGSFELDSILRSQRSPEVLRFRVGLPEGAILEQSGGSTGPVFVREDGQRIATVLPPNAVDAQGTQVTGVTMVVSGDVLTITVPHPTGAYAYPLSVDPYVTDELLASTHTNWRETNVGGKFAISGLSGSGSVTIAGSGSYALGEAGMLFYPINPGSEARITSVSVEVSATLEGHNAEAAIQLENNTKKVEKEERFSSNISKSNIGVRGECWKTSNPECPFASEEGTPENLARLSLRATGTGEGASMTALRAFVDLEQEKGPELSFDKTDPTVDGGLTNILYSGGWLGPHSKSAFEIHAKDPGLGISYFGIAGGSWGEKFPIYEDGECEGVQCDPEFNKGFTYSSKMTNGEDALEAIAYDAANKDSVLVWPQYIKVDATPPHNIVLSGLGPGGQVGAGEYHLKAEATDGTEPTLSSGMKSLKLFIDGHEIGSSSASCSPGPCTGHSGTWTIFGHNYATGRHTVTVEAEDNAGNISSESFTMIVHPASPIALGPGSFNPQSGEYSMSVTDVSMGGGLTVSRSYGSEHTTAGTGGPLGAQWQVSLGGQESLVKQPTGSYVLTDASGAQTIFAPNGTGGYISPAGDSNLTLSSTPCEVGQTEFSLKNSAADTTTCFKVPSGGSGEIWSPHITQGDVATDTTTYAYETVEVPSGSKKYVTRPHEALAPVPAGVSCSPTLKAGCRALTFNYATTTTAKGEASTEWGDVEGNLTRVYYTAWEPIGKEMKKVEVAHYEYDKQGRLRVVWDPRIKPEPLKTYYGYDSEGHLSALTPPGQETLGIVYGTISGSANPGAVLKVTQAPPATALWSGEGLTNTEAPKLTGARATGGRMAVTEGKWSGDPIVYGYQWEDCSGGGECTQIAGATNANYTPTSKDEGYFLSVQVTATNGSGSVTVTASSLPPTYSSAFGTKGSGNGQFSSPRDVATDSAGNVWVADSENSRVEELNAEGVFVRAFGSAGTGNGQFKVIDGIAVDSKGDVWVTDAGNARIQEFTSEGVFVRTFGSYGTGNGQLVCPEGLAVDGSGNVWVADTCNGRVEEFSSSGVFVKTVGSYGSGNGEFYSPTDVAFDTKGDMWVTDRGNDRVEEFNTEGSFVRAFGSSGSGNGQFNEPERLTVSPQEDNIWVADTLNNRVQVFSPTGVYQYQFGTSGSGGGQFNRPEGIAIHAGNVYVGDRENNRIQKWVLSSGEGEVRPAQPGSTVEYTVPVSGGGAPHAMGAKEVEEGWAQKDVPAEATAVFPPDEPQGWPASDYKRATIYYRDSTERTVNVAGPSGGISTSEYNATNDLIRSLNPDNRTIALKEAKPAVVAKELDSQSEYNSEGTELLSTLGPRHAIKLASGEEVQARNHTVYEYDDEAPTEGGPYHLVTKTTQGAEIEGKGEQEVRTVLTGYSGQGGLGWKLRKPTSVTTAPNGLNLTRTTVYDEATGNITDTIAPAGAILGLPVYSSAFGTKGSGNGQFSSPRDVATDSAGNVWVADSENSRVEELNAEGVFVRAFGSAGTGNGQFKVIDGIAVDSKGDVWVTDAGNARIQEFTSEGVFVRAFGSYGTGNGQLVCPEGLAVDGSGNVWVADTCNGRVEEFSSSGVFVKTVGSYGSGNGEFYSPTDVAFDTKGDMWVTDRGNDRVEEFNTEGSFVRAFGSSGSGNGQFNEPERLTVSPHEGDIWVADTLNNRVQVFSPTGVYQYQFGTSGSGSGQFNRPEGIAIHAGNVYVGDRENNRIQKWVGKTAVHDTQTIYYTTAANSKYTKCGEHPEWANLPCQTQPAEQPNTSGLPGIPITTYTYNMYGEPTQVKAEVARAGGGTDTRTTTTTYDEASRPETTETSSTVGTALPKVTDKYSYTTGALTEQNTSRSLSRANTTH